MEQMWRFFEGADAAAGPFGPYSILLSLLLAFVLGQMLAWVYYATHSGLSYSRTFVQSLILISVVVSLVMAVIGNSIITAFGLMGALAIIRFRNVLKDTRDMAFVFCTLVIGMACGSQRYAVAVIGAICLCAIALYLHWTAFGSHRPHNGFLRFRVVGTIGPDDPVLVVLKQFCSSYNLISVQESGLVGAAEYAYQVMIKSHERDEQMLFELEKLGKIDNVNLTMQEELLEV